MKDIDDISEQKAALRKQAFAARKAAHASAKAGTGASGKVSAHHASEAARANAMAETWVLGLASRSAAVVAGYVPIRTEIDPRPLMTALHHLGLRICVPVIRGAGLPLDFAEWWPGCRLIDGPFGASVPDGTPLLLPDTVIVPLVAFDLSGWRLGYGGGFYDRTLSLLRHGRQLRAIGLAYAAQCVDGVPTESTDQRLDAVVTDTAVITFGTGAP